MRVSDQLLPVHMSVCSALCRCSVLCNPFEELQREAKIASTKHRSCKAFPYVGRTQLTFSSSCLSTLP